MHFIRSLKFLLSILVISHLQSAAQTTIQVILKNPANRKIDKVDAFDLSQQEIHQYKYKDTLLLEFKKDNIDCYNIRYHEKDKMYRQQIWLDPGSIKIEAHLTDKDLVIDTVINSPFYYASVIFNEQYVQLTRSRDTIAINNFLMSSFEKYIDNPYSINIAYYYVLRNQNSKPDLVKFKSLTDKQGDRFKWFLLYPIVVERLNKILSVDKIDVSGYSFLNKSKQPTTLQLKHSEYYVLDFWFLACKPCVEQHMKIKKNLPGLNSKSVEVIGISTDSDLKKWKAYLAKHGYEWPNYMENKKQSISKDLSIVAFPTYLILNRKGEIVNSYNSISEVLKRFGVDDGEPKHLTD